MEHLLREFVFTRYVNHPGWEDDRHCHNGLWDYPNDRGEREIYLPLAEELSKQRREFEQLFTSGVGHHSSTPRPEYPRPDFIRPLWINLNGEWEFEFDDANEGLQSGWYDGRSLTRRIVVPFPYQSQLSGINDKSVHECVWYARTVELSEENRERDLLLNFGAVDYAATVWVNGHEVGHHQGGHVPFQFDIAPYVRTGANRLSIRVEDRQDPQQPRGKQSHTGLPHGIDYYCTTGIWQTVWLEPVPPIRIEELRISTDAKRNILDVTVFLHAPSCGWRIEVEVQEDGKNRNIPPKIQQPLRLVNFV